MPWRFTSVPENVRLLRSGANGQHVCPCREPHWIPSSNTQKLCVPSAACRTIGGRSLMQRHWAAQSDIVEMSHQLGMVWISPCTSTALPLSDASDPSDETLIGFSPHFVVGTAGGGQLSSHAALGCWCEHANMARRSARANRMRVGYASSG